MLKIMTAGLALFSSLVSGQGSQHQEVLSDPPLDERVSFQGNLWQGLWQEEFESGSDFLIISSDPALSNHTVHRIDFDDNFLGGEVAAGSLSELLVFDMSWADSGVHSITVSYPEGDWAGTYEYSMMSFSSVITSNGGYNPAIYGIAVHITVIDDPAESSEQVSYTVLMPMGRGVSLEAADSAAEAIATGGFPVTVPRADQVDDCWAIYSSRRNNAAQDYFDDVDDCSALGGAVAGGVSGLATGSIIGSIFPVIGTKIGAGVGLVTGAIGGGIWGKQDCIDDAKDDYNRRYRNDWRCYQLCVHNGNWGC